MANATRLPADLAGALALIDSLTVQRDAAEALAKERDAAIADRDAAQQMVAECKAAIQDMFDKAPSVTPSDAEWKAAAVASLAARKLLTLSAPTAGRWCLASERDEAIEKNTSMRATIERLSAACGAAEASAEKAEAREKAIGDELEKATDRIEGLVKENERFRHAAAETADLLMRGALEDDLSSAQQMVAELRAVLVRRHAHDVAGGICDTPERCSCDDDVTAILEQAAPIDGRWCLASERDETMRGLDAAIARAEKAEARLVQGCSGCASDPVCRQCSDAEIAEYLRSLVAAAERRESEAMRSLDAAIARAEKAETSLAEWHGVEAVGPIAVGPIAGRWCLASERDDAVNKLAGAVHAVADAVATLDEVEARAAAAESRALAAERRESETSKRADTADRCASRIVNALDRGNLPTGNSDVESAIARAIHRVEDRADAADQMVAELRAALTAGRDIVIETSTGSRHARWVEGAYDTLEASASIAGPRRCRGTPEQRAREALTPNKEKP